MRLSAADYQYDIQTHYIEKWIEHSENFSQMNATAPHQRGVNIASGNDLVLSGNKPLPELRLTQISVTIWHHWATGLYRVSTEYAQSIAFFMVEGAVSY